MNQYIQRGETFLDNCLFDGLAHSFDVVKETYVKPYPEVTGYIIKYFCDYGTVTEKIKAAGDYLIEIQDKKTGGWPSFYEQHYLYTFDTAQILTGLCALYRKTKEKRYLDAAYRAGKFLTDMQCANGAFIPVYDKNNEQKVTDKKIYHIWNGPFSGLMCKLTEAFNALYSVTDEKQFLSEKNRAADFYSDAEYIEYTHPLGYWLEGLYAAERYERVEVILEKKVIPRIRNNGYIPYKENLEYAYVSGVIQLGILLKKMGYENEALLIKEYGRKVQSYHWSGGLFQYADAEGRLDQHVHTEINSWGTKYFCELERISDHP